MDSMARLSSLSSMMFLARLHTATSCQNQQCSSACLAVRRLSGSSWVSFDTRSLETSETAFHLSLDTSPPSGLSWWRVWPDRSWYRITPSDQQSDLYV